MVTMYAFVMCIGSTCPSVCGSTRDSASDSLSHSLRPSSLSTSLSASLSTHHRVSQVLGCVVRDVKQLSVLRHHHEEATQSLKGTKIAVREENDCSDQKICMQVGEGLVVVRDHRLAVRFPGTGTELTIFQICLQSDYIVNLFPAEKSGESKAGRS